MRDHTEIVPVSGDSLPDLLASARRQLELADGIESVLEIRNKAEALKVYAQKRGAAVGAQNDCAAFVALCERRIGDELKKAKDAGLLAESKDTLKRGPVVEDSHHGKIFLSEIGLTKDDSRDLRRLAGRSEADILEAAASATAEGRRVLKRELAGLPKGKSGQQLQREREHKEMEEMAEKARRAQEREHLRLVHSRDNDSAEQLCILLARLKDISDDFDPEELYGKFPDRLRHNLIYTLRPAAIFVAKFHAAFERAERKENAAS